MKGGKTGLPPQVWDQPTVGAILEFDYEASKRRAGREEEKSSPQFPAHSRDKTTAGDSNTKKHITSATTRGNVISMTARGMNSVHHVRNNWFFFKAILWEIIFVFV